MSSDEAKRRARVIRKIRLLRNKIVAAGCTEDEAKSSAELARRRADPHDVVREAAKDFEAHLRLLTEK